jgi:4-alpha-glucanotransferase
VTTLPNVNEMTNSYREFIINGEDSVVKHWLRCGAKGWRLDVADELPDKFIKELRDAAKSTDGQSVIIGEVWEDASNKVSYGVQREYLLGGELDSVMNYPFRDGVTGYIMGWHGAEHFEKIVMSVYENYPLPCFYSLMNLIGGHDVTRAKTLFGNAPDLPPEERAAYRHDYDADLLAGKRMRLASLWQLTFPGVPCIYYGDEIGMEGYSDPFNRAPFRWDDMDAGLLEWYQKLIKIRNGFAPLRTGGYETIFAEGDIFCYKREIRRGRDALGSKRESGTAYIALNRSEYSARRVSIGTGAYRALYDPVRNETIPTDGGKVELTLPPVSGVLYIGKNLVD